VKFHVFRVEKTVNSFVQSAFSIRHPVRGSIADHFNLMPFEYKFIAKFSALHCIAGN
jgi:hypothetical protein